MATQKQIEANRRNAQRSTGPRTEEGKAAAKYNALTHGFRARGLDILPHEDPSLFNDRIDAWFADYNPTGEAEAELVRRAAILSWKLDRADRHEAAALSRRVREAAEKAEKALDDRFFESAQRLLPAAEDCRKDDHEWAPAAGLLEAVEGSAKGCRWLLARWRWLRKALRSDPFWIPEFEMEAIRLLGAGPFQIAEPEVLDLVVANRVLMTGPVDPFDRVDGPLGLGFEPGAMREACFRQPEGPEAAVALLEAAADRAIARLEGLLEVREREGDAGSWEVAEAAEFASFDPGDEAERLRRYQAGMRREFVKTVETIARLRFQQAKLDRELAKMPTIGANEASRMEIVTEAESGTGSGRTRAVPVAVSAAQTGANEAYRAESGTGSGRTRAVPVAVSTPPAVTATNGVRPEPVPISAAGAAGVGANEAKLTRRQRRRLLAKRRGAA